MRRLTGFDLVCLSLLQLGEPAAAGCVASPTLQPANTMPALTGRLASQSGRDGDSYLYLYDFGPAALHRVGLTWGLTQMRNPNFSPNGQWITFSAIKNNNRDVYVWKINAAQPVNLTNSTGATVNEDPKFSFDWNCIIFKQNGNIRRLMLETGPDGNLAVMSTLNVTSDGMLSNPDATCHDSYLEFSAPVLTFRNTTAYYYRGGNPSSCAPLISSIALATHVTTELKSPGTTEQYYPILSRDGTLFYIAHTPGQGSNDQIFMQGASGGVQPSFNDCDSDNSDPAVVDDDHVIFSSDRVLPNDRYRRYRLYLGQVSTGFVWEFSALDAQTSPHAPLGSGYAQH